MTIYQFPNRQYARDDDSFQSEHLSGSIERITFHSEQTGFCVLKIRVKDDLELITVTGNAAAVSVGENIECQGSFVTDRIYGKQFKSSKMQIVPPSTIEGIERYLASGLLKGIGPHFATKLIKAFGESVFNIIEENPEQLLTLPGLGQSRLQSIVSSWAEQKVVRDIMVFLQSYGVSTAKAVRIYKAYGREAIAIVSKNPYQLALDIHGIGFASADSIALNLGIARDSLIRAQAGVRHSLQDAGLKGHCACIFEELIKNTGELLAVDENLVKTAIAEEITTGNVVSLLRDGKQLIYLKVMFAAEIETAEKLLRIKQGENDWSSISFDDALNILAKEEINLAPSQLTALELALNNKVIVITGGPGVGKTTLVNSILKIFEIKEAKIALCAPTGRASKRLSAATGMPAKTIHRLLEFDPSSGDFIYNQDNQLPINVVIVDEASMIDITLMNKLLRAIPDNASLVLVGDVDQLPSVGPGAVLSDIIESQVIKTAYLTEIFRQAASSKVITNAHRINNGLMPETNNETDELSDFYFVQAESTEEILQKLLTVVCERIPKRFDFDA